MTVDSHGLIAWIVIGLVAGALASRIVEGRGLGCLGDLVVGVAGAVIGGALMNHLTPGYQYEFLGSIVVAFIGAAILLSLLRLLSGGRPLGRGGGWGRRRGLF
ncbi:MAG TPA: GlsB/YeaQ/YmgE family stress response membrane protein [Candidatus Dormibacteraeota bacterium]|nr:GlsB/YeaQ/YmgE family stress response membrane protein [Candidatus Dormibacteraeota bacterium]